MGGPFCCLQLLRGAFIKDESPRPQRSTVANFNARGGHLLHPPLNLHVPRTKVVAALTFNHTNRKHMKPFTVCFTALALLLSCTKAFSQQPEQTVNNGAYVKEETFTKAVIPYPHLREADVMYAKRVWQVMDLREKMNHPYYFPIDKIADRKSLFDVIRHGLLVENSLSAYGLGPTDDDDEFRYMMSRNELDSLLNPVVTHYSQHLETGEMRPVRNITPIQSADITQYKIKEDWIFDKQRSQRVVRIIGIAPMMEAFNDDGEKIGYKTLFWLYFPECRYVFANWEAFNFHSDSQRRSFEDLFQKRLFSSYVVKESNVYDRSIAGYTRGVQALLESERIKQDLFEFEHDLWHY